MGTKASSMGGAFVGLSDDWSATYWNPAGLAGVKKAGWGINLRNHLHTFWDTDSVSNLDPSGMDLLRGDVLPGIYESEPDKFKEKRYGGVFRLPSLGAYLPWKKYTVGIGIYNPLGNYIDWNDEIRDPTTQARILGAYYNKFFMLTISGAIARNLGQKISIAVGTNLIYSQLQTDINKHYINIHPHSLQPDYHFGIRSKGRGVGIEGVVGLIYRPFSFLNLGLVYRTGGSVRLKGDAVGWVPFGQRETTSFRQHFRKPPSWGIGLAFKPSNKLTLASDLQITDWDLIRIDLDYDRAGSVLQDIHKDPGWYISYRYRFGIDFKFNEHISLRAGFTMDERGMPDGGSGMTQIPMTYQKIATMGMEYKWHSISFELAYERMWGHQTLVGSDMGEDGNIFTLGMAHHF
jgi:long-chain fatty acid transport protein